MHVPKGNPLIEEVPLPLSDINVMLTNLETDSFTGYVQLDLTGTDGMIFFSHGSMLRAVEVDHSSGSASVVLLPRMLGRVKGRDVSTSSYVLSSQIVGVLSGIFAFQPLYLDYEVKRKELKKVLTNLEEGEFSGIMKMATRDGTSFLLLDRGELVIDRFIRQYGQILCGTDAVSKLLDYVHKHGATINVYAEKAEEIENRRRATEEDLEKIKQLIAKIDQGLFRAGDVVKVDEYIVREWGIDLKATFNVELETPDGSIYEYKCQAAKKLGGYAGLTQAMLKKMNLREGDLLSVRPAQ
ncbi:MAG TPA: hypothetical protein VNO81_02825 [Candidatus Nitrosotenuis sp.]|nr:hypothetical protein [Candidatus Nitrosotenuis sp.]